MLNISKDSIKDVFFNNTGSSEISKQNTSTLKMVESKVSGNVLRKMLYLTLLATIIILFLPWTQNVRTSGVVATLHPQQGPQNINTIIGGQIDQWFVQEGDFVNKGDTILRIKETKDAYFDKELLPRTKNQIELKKQAIITYADKIKNQEDQLSILKNQRGLNLNQAKIKLNQTALKVKSDSVAHLTAVNNLKIAEYQMKRIDSLYLKGLKSLTSVETRRIKLQQAENSKVKAENIWLNSKSELVNKRIEVNNVDVKYNAEINKIDFSIYSTVSSKIDAESELNKLENQYSNYEFRRGLYYIIAPQNGFITKISIGGLNESVKAGEEILTLMPEDYDLIVEIFVNPVDFPLMQIGQKVRLQFDGWPAIVFSGWPNASHGTYGGEVYAIDQFISKNGKYRLLVKPDENDYIWPHALRFGGGTSSMIMLNDVPIWYELWRNINGFPPNFYTQKDLIKSKKTK